MKKKVKNRFDRWCNDVFTCLNLTKSALFAALFSVITTQLTAQEAENRVPIPVIYGDTLKDNHLVVSFVEQQPQFIGGQKALFKFLSQNIHYTSDSSGIDKTIYVGFVVETDGTLSDVKIKRGTSPLNEEVLRVVKLMSGQWTCGYQNGKPMPVAFTLPIRIHLE